MTRDLTPRSWIERRTYRSTAYPVERIKELKRDRTISVLLPAREVAATIGSLLDGLMPLVEDGMIDELVVIDADSADGTGAIAADRGAAVHQREAILPDYGPALGKGDAIWRGLAVTSGDVVVIMDTDTQNFGRHFFLGLVGPLLQDDKLRFVKGAFRRPLQLAGKMIPDEGGRVTELVARPLLNLYLPQLAGFVQPLAGEVAAHRDLLESIPIPVGYGVEIGMLIDALGNVGIEAMAQVDLGTRQDSAQSLRNLSAMALAVTSTLIRRVHGEDALESLEPGTLLMPDGATMEPVDVPLQERPPLRDVFQTDAAQA